MHNKVWERIHWNVSSPKGLCVLVVGIRRTTTTLRIITETRTKRTRRTSRTRTTRTTSIILGNVTSYSPPWPCICTRILTYGSSDRWSIFKVYCYPEKTITHGASAVNAWKNWNKKDDTTSVKGGDIDCINFENKNKKNKKKLENKDNKNKNENNNAVITRTISRQ